MRAIAIAATFVAALGVVVAAGFAAGIVSPPAGGIVIAIGGAALVGAMERVDFV